MPRWSELPGEEPAATNDEAPRRAARRERVAVAVGLVVALIVGGAVGWSVRGPGEEADPEAEEGAEEAGGAPFVARPPDMSAHADDPWADAYYDALDGRELVYDPYLSWALPDGSVPGLTVEDGIRASLETSVAGEALEVWFLGGSTMFGIGQRDEHTIPSEVVRLAAADGVPVEAVNYGVGAYVNWQETVLLARELAAHGPPDAVVFYDGVNDRTVGAQYGPLDEPWTLFADQVDEVLAAESPILAATGPPGDGTQDPGEWYRQYGRGVEVARALADGYRVPVLHLLHPELQSKEPWSEADRRLLQALGVDPDAAEAQRAALRQAATTVPDGVIPLLDALDGVQDAVYTDFAHTNEAGAAVVAARVWAELRPVLREGPGGVS